MRSGRRSPQHHTARTTPTGWSARSATDRGPRRRRQALHGPAGRAPSAAGGRRHRVLRGRHLNQGIGVRGDAQGDVLANIEYLVGSNHADWLVGTVGNNAIAALGGNDTLHGLAGADTLDGGAGVDIASYETAGTGVSVDLNQGIGVGGDAQGDVLANIEYLVGSNHADWLVGTVGNNAIGPQATKRCTGSRGAPAAVRGVDIASYEPAGTGGWARDQGRRRRAGRRSRHIGRSGRLEPRRQAGRHGRQQRDRGARRQ
ncbi:MAG: hypothetical protein IPM60_09405 [Rhodospirillales bacterium]|nr:hypothetical protein [Rhodospirillales bacterium]